MDNHLTGTAISDFLTVPLADNTLWEQFKEIYCINETIERLGTRSEE